jgi:hypothetical protein
MADSKNQPVTPSKNPNPDAETIKGDVEEKVNEEQEQGFFGTKVDPRPDSDYSLESGPDSPPAVEDDRSRVEHPHA